MSQNIVVGVDITHEQRKRDLKIKDDIAEQANLKARKNSDFTQVSSKGWKRLQSLINTHPPLARLYAFFAEHIDGVTGTVVCSQEFIATRLDIHIVTVRRQTQQLEKLGALVRIRVGSGVYAYALDPHEIWKSWANKKDHAAFVTRTLVDLRDSHNREVHRKLKTMYIEK